MRKKDDEAPKVEVVVRGETGEVVLQVYREHVVMTVRQPHHERFAEVRLTQPQLTALQGVFDQLGPDPLGGDDDE